MWAMIPMLRYRSRGTCSAICDHSVRSGCVHGTTEPSGSVVGAHPWGAMPREVRGLPAVVGEGLVGLGHLVDVLLALHRSADAVAGVEQLVGEALGHGLLTALPREAHDPADGEGVGTAGLD